MTDPAKRKVWYHKIDSVSQIAAQYNIPNEYDKLMAAIGSQGTNAYTSNDVTCYVENIPSNEMNLGRKCKATASKIWSFVASIQSLKLYMKSTIWA